MAVPKNLLVRRCQLRYVHMHVTLDITYQTRTSERTTMDTACCLSCY